MTETTHMPPALGRGHPTFSRSGRRSIACAATSDLT